MHLESLVHRSKVTLSSATAVGRREGLKKWRGRKPVLPGACSLEERLPSPYGAAVEMCSVAKVTTEPSVQKLLWAAATSRVYGNQAVLPAQMDATCSSANILYLWAWNSSQRLCPDWAATVGLSPVAEQHASLHTLDPSLLVWNSTPPRHSQASTTPPFSAMSKVASSLNKSLTLLPNKSFSMTCNHENA